MMTRALQALWCVSTILSLSIQFELISADLTVEPGKEVTIQPQASAQVQSFAFLTCNILPVNATVDSRWVIPNGQIINAPSKRYRIAQGPTDTGQMTSVLLIQNLSFKDEGYYTCEVVPRGFSKSLCNCNDFPFSATTKLELLVNLLVAEAEITVKQGEDDLVQLVCEMRDYIRPDEDLLWFKGGDPIYGSMDSRFTITFEDGEPNTAQNGGNSTVASRRSVLRILDPVVADSGKYTCKVRGTTQRMAISLTVTEAEDQEPTSEALTLGNGTPRPTTESKEPHATQADPEIDDNINRVLTSTVEEMSVGVSTSTTLNPAISCDLGHTQLAAAIICTFVLTAVIAVLLTLLVVCVCVKPRKNETEKRAASPPDCGMNGNGVISAVNTHTACEEANMVHS